MLEPAQLLHLLWGKRLEWHHVDYSGTSSGSLAASAAADKTALCIETHRAGNQPAREHAQVTSLSIVHGGILLSTAWSWETCM